MRTPYLHIAVLTAFMANTIGPWPCAQAQDFRLPAPGVMVRLSPEFNPPMLKGIRVHPESPFQFDFILDKGDSELDNDQLKDESGKLIKYFLASLTIPEKDLWVNLSPYEKDRIIPSSFGLTEMGRDMLAEDYMLKQITASLIYPEDEIGKKFWKRIYEEAAKKFGTTNIPVNTFNKVWIVPEKAVVYENAKAGTAYVVESTLKVMLEQDYLSMSKHVGRGVTERGASTANALGSQIVREIVIPELTKEVNNDKNFSHLRQVYNSLILATWYKKKIKDSLLALVYDNKNKIAGVNIDDPQEKQKIYERYLQAFKKGAYNYIKEETDPLTQQLVPRKYFSGGEALWSVGNVMKVSSDSAMVDDSVQNNSGDVEVSVNIKDAAMTGEVENAQSLGERTKQEDRLSIDQNFNLEDYIDLNGNGQTGPGEFPNKSGHLMAVFDGHSRSGQAGDEIAQLAKDQLPQIFSQQLLNFRGNVERAFVGTFRRLSGITRDFTSGTTVTIAYIPQADDKIYYAVLGDSPLFVVKKNGSFEMAPTHTLENFNHNPEVARIQKYFERNNGYIAPTGVYVHNDAGQTKSSKVPRALGSKELGGVISKVPVVGVMETNLADVATLGLGSDGILSNPNDSKDSIKQIVEKIQLGLSARDIVDDLQNYNDDNRSLILWHPGEAVVADRAMAVSTDGKGFHPSDPVRFKKMLKYFSSGNAAELFNEGAVINTRDWTRFFEQFGKYRLIKGMSINMGLNSIERVPNAEVFSQMENDLRDRLPPVEAQQFVSQLEALKSALAPLQERPPHDWNDLTDPEKIGIAYFNKDVLAGILDGSLPVSDHVATVVLNELISQWRRTQALSDSDFWRIFRVNQRWLSTTAMRRALVRAIYVGDYFQIAKAKNARLRFDIKTSTGSVEVDDENFVIKDLNGNIVSADTQQLEQETMRHVRTFALQYIMEGLERFPNGLIAKMQVPMNFDFTFDLTSRKSGVQIAHFIPARDPAFRHVKIQIDGNPKGYQLEEIVTSLDHEMTHYLAFSENDTNPLLPFDDYHALIQEMGFKRFSLSSGIVKDRTSTISGTDDIYSYYQHDSPYFYAIHDPMTNTFIVFEDDKVTQEGQISRFKKLETSLEGVYFEGSGFEVLPDNGVRHYYLNPDEAVAYTASETREKTEKLLSQKSLEGKYQDILDILQRNLLRSSLPVAQTEDGRMIYEVYTPNVEDSEDGFVTSYRDDQGKTYTTLREAMGLSPDRAMAVNGVRLDRMIKMVFDLKKSSMDTSTKDLIRKSQAGFRSILTNSRYDGYSVDEYINLFEGVAAAHRYGDRKHLEEFRGYTPKAGFSAGAASPERIENIVNQMVSRKLLLENDTRDAVRVMPYRDLRARTLEIAGEDFAHVWKIMMKGVSARGERNRVVEFAEKVLTGTAYPSVIDAPLGMTPSSDDAMLAELQDLQGQVAAFMEGLEAKGPADAKDMADKIRDLVRMVPTQIITKKESSAEYSQRLKDLKAELRKRGASSATVPLSLQIAQTQLLMAGLIITGQTSLNGFTARMNAVQATMTGVNNTLSSVIRILSQTPAAQELKDPQWNAMQRQLNLSWSWLVNGKIDRAYQEIARVTDEYTGRYYLTLKGYNDIVRASRGLQENIRLRFREGESPSKEQKSRVKVLYDRLRATIIYPRYLATTENQPVSQQEDISRRIDIIAALIRENRMEQAQIDLEQLKELYFSKEQSIPGMRRVAQALLWASTIFDSNHESVLRLLTQMKADLWNKDSFRVRVIGYGWGSGEIFMPPGINAWDLIVSLGRSDDYIAAARGHQPMSVSVTGSSIYGIAKLRQRVLIDGDSVTLEIPVTPPAAPDRAMAAGLRQAAVSAAFAFRKLIPPILPKRQAEPSKPTFSGLSVSGDKTKLRDLVNRELQPEILDGKQFRVLTGSDKEALLDGGSRLSMSSVSYANDQYPVIIHLTSPGANMFLRLGEDAIKIQTPGPILELIKKALDADAAMSAGNKGGIDLTLANMNLLTQNSGEAIKFHLDPAMFQQLQNAPGFTPVIINIQPMPDIRAFLGLAEIQK